MTDKIQKIADRLLIKDAAAQHRAATRYGAFCVFFVCFFIFFCTTNLWVPYTNKASSTQIGTKVSTSQSVSLILEEWSYNPNKAFMQVLFQVEYTSDTGYSSNLKFTPKLYYRTGTDNTAVEVDTCKVAYSDEDYVVVTISDLPSNWAALSLHMSDNMNDIQAAEQGNPNAATEVIQPQTSSATIEQSEGVFYASTDSVQNNTTLKEETPDVYSVECLQKSLVTLQSQVKAANDQISKNDETIDSVQKDIDTLRSNQSFETDDEQQQSDSRIANRQEVINNLNKQNSDLQEQVAKLQEKIEKKVALLASKKTS